MSDYHTAHGEEIDADMKDESTNDYCDEHYRELSDIMNDFYQDERKRF